MRMTPEWRQFIDRFLKEEGLTLFEYVIRSVKRDMLNRRKMDSPPSPPAAEKEQIKFGMTDLEWEEQVADIKSALVR